MVLRKFYGEISQGSSFQSMGEEFPGENFLAWSFPREYYWQEIFAVAGVEMAVGCRLKPFQIII